MQFYFYWVAVILTSLHSLSNSLTHVLPSGDIMFMMSHNEYTYDEAVSNCDAIGAVLIDTSTRVIKNEVMDFLNKDAWNHAWLGAIKIGYGNAYVWNSTKEYVNFTLNRWDSSKPKCRDNCCRLKLIEWGFVAGVPCHTRDVAKTLCLFRSNSIIKSDLGSLKRQIVRHQHALSWTKTGYVKLLKRDFILKRLVEEESQVVSENLTFISRQRLSLESKTSDISKILLERDKELSSLRRSNSVLFTIFGLSIVVILCILAFNINMLIILTPEFS